MLKSLKKTFSSLLDILIPPRSDFEIVRKLNEEDITNLPKADKVQDEEWIHPLFKYKDNKVRAIIWELKYKNNTYPLEIIGKLFFDEIVSLTSDIFVFDSDAKFILIPIPITNTRRSERGYNQSEYICRAILENDTGHILLYAPQWLQKVKETTAQNKSQSKEDRIKNMIGSFEAKEDVSNQYVILIDDVVTTGSTLNEAKRELLEKFAKDVFAFTIAH